MSASIPHVQADREESVRLRTMNFEERGRLLQSACRAAMQIYRSRLAAGLPDVAPEPWHPSTLELLSKRDTNV